MKAKELIEKYESYEAKYGADAPVAMLCWLRRVDHVDDVQCQALVPVIEKYLVERCVDVYEATWIHTDLDAGEEYQKAADKTLETIRRARIVETMARSIDEI